jgi:hypothetical protein
VTVLLLPHRRARPGELVLPIGHGWETSKSK